MPETHTFHAKSGNVALLTIKGYRGDLVVVDVSWDHTPSKKDIRACNEWFASLSPHCKGILQCGNQR